MKDDAAIRRTRDARRGISADAGHDPEKVVEYYMQLQKRFAARLRPGPRDNHEEDEVAEGPLAADRQKDARR